jgi:RimJ/RimL family protein N-acetyltransferase
MYPVYSEFFPRIERFFTSDQPGYPMARSVLENRCPGTVWVDHPQNPTTALVALDHRFLIPGETMNPDFLHAAVRQLQRENRLHLVWTEPSRHRLKPPPSRVLEVERREFRDRDRSTRFALSAPDDVRVCKITADLAPRCQWTHEMERIFGGLRRFFVHGLGFCLIRGESILAEAYAAFWGDSQVEIAVVTDQAHRRQGHGLRICAELIGACEAMGFETYWSCDSRNRGSMKLAERLGYRSCRGYRLLEYPALRPERAAG